MSTQSNGWWDEDVPDVVETLVLLDGCGYAESMAAAKPRSMTKKKPTAVKARAAKPATAKTAKK